MEPQLVVNGRPRPLGDVGAHLTLLEWLRADGLTGGKEGCAEGECGACAVLVARPDADGSRWTAINACLAPVAALDGQEVITSEGLGQPGALHPVQQEMADRGGSQCGYCTPGFICSMAAEFYRRDRRANGADLNGADLNGAGPGAAAHAADHEHGPNGFDLHALSGNLCRCTGYRPIRDAAYALGQPAADDPLQARSLEPAPAAPATTIRHGQGDFVRPSSLAEVLELLADRPEARLLAGSTDWGVELNLRHARAPLTVAIDRLDELRQLEVRDDVVEVGAALSLTEIERGLDGQVPLLADLFPQFASRLIRNTATLGGNLGTGSPIGDSLPVLLALEAELVLASTQGERVVPLADYFTGYRQTLRRPDELIKIVRIPRPLAPISAFQKIAKRRFDDISSISVAFAMELDDDSVRSIRIGLGGVAATPLRARATEEMLTGGPWTADAVSAAAQTLEREGTPLDDHRASAAFRSAMLRQALLKFHAQHQPLMEVAR
jgi:xanthine dehydrogenase small subunit